MAIAMADEQEYGRNRSAGNLFAGSHPLNREWSSGDVSGGAAFNEIQYPLSSVFSEPGISDYIRPWANGLLVKNGDFVSETTRVWRVESGATTATSVGAVTPTWGTPSLGATVVQAPITYKYVGLLAGIPTLKLWKFGLPSFGSASDDFNTFTIEEVDLIRGRRKQAAYGIFNAFGIESGRADEVSVSGEVLARNLARDSSPSAGATAISPVSISPTMVDIFFAPDPAGLDLVGYAAAGNPITGGKMEGNFSYSIELGGRYNTAWVHDTSLSSWKEPVLAEPTLELSMTIAEDAFSDSVLAGARRGDRAYARFRAKGPLLDPAGHVDGPRYLFQWDTAIAVNDAPGADDQDDAAVVEISFEAEHAPGWTATRNGTTGAYGTTDTAGKATEAYLVIPATAL
jgi:hypothetical protein